MYRAWQFVSNYSLLLISGSVLALAWANFSAQEYHAFVDFVLLKDSFIGHLHVDAEGQAHRTLTMHYLVNDVLMAFFFAIAAKEVWEAVALEGGALRGRKALTPLLATVGGMIGPVAVYLGIALVLGSETYSAVANGWAIPTATDIAFSYLVGRIVFGAGHPAVRFLLLLAIADDAAGLLILAIFYPSGELVPEWLLLTLGASVGVYVLFNWLPKLMDKQNSEFRHFRWVRRVFSYWPYAIAGALCWYGFQESGLHPALGLIPIVPAIPHADGDRGVFAAHEKHLEDFLNKIEHFLKSPVEFVLFLFGLVNAGVKFSAIGVPTTLVLLGLLVGKPVGIFLFGWFGAVPLKLGIPVGMRVSDILVVGFVAAIGFTVALFIATVAFDPGEIQDAAKMGALLSIGAAAISIFIGKLLRTQKQP